MLKELGNEISIDEKKKIKEDFQDTLLAFCETVIPNGSRRGDEWDCADIFKSERTEGDQGSCSVNLVSGVFHDHNPDANPQSGGAHAMFCAILGLKGAAGWRAMRRWNEDRTLPDGQVGAATGRKVAKLSEGSDIEAGDKYEQSRIKWIHTFQDWITYSQENGGAPEKTAQYGITRSNVRIWLLKNKFTFQKKRLPANGNHLVLVLTPKDAARAVALRRSQGFAITD
jgi:phage terminase large subunit-like protein